MKILMTVSLLIISSPALAELKLNSSAPVPPKPDFYAVDTEEQKTEEDLLVQEIKIESIRQDSMLERFAVKTEPYFMFQHQSDLLRGAPFYMHDDRYDPTVDYIAFGVKVELNNKWELDISQGWKSFDCSARKHCGWETGTQASIKWYPWRNQ